MTKAFCTGCGLEVRPADAFCRSCGAAQSTEAPPRDDPFAAGTAALRLGQAVRAVNLLAMAAEIEPDSARVWLALGSACRQAKQYGAERQGRRVEEQRGDGSPTRTGDMARYQPSGRGERRSGAEVHQVEGTHRAQAGRI